jgi:hypothetical protein
MKPAIYQRRFAAPRLHFLNFPSFLVLMLLSMNAPGQRSDVNGFAVLRLNEVNSHASRHFLAHFSPSTTVKWFQDEQHYVASFQEGDSTDRVYYKSNGNFDYCIKYYGATALDGNLKSAVLEKFPGCEIMTITELTDLDKKNLFIKIKDGAYIRTLSCSNEGIEITENIKDSGS